MSGRMLVVDGATYRPEVLRHKIVQDAARARAERGISAPALAVAVGLVPSETSQECSVYGSIAHGHKGFSICKAVTPFERRMKRLGRTKKTVITSARLSVEEAQRGGFRGSWAMCTLTYRDGVPWTSKQIARLTQHVREYMTRKAMGVMRYVWVLELTKKGRPHYHLLVWMPRGRSLPKPDKQGWWPHGSTRIEWAEKPVGYIAKYASKGVSHEEFERIPKGARMCGAGGLTSESRTELRYWKLPTWVRDVWDAVCDVTPVKGGYCRRSVGLLPCGEVLASPWKVIFRGGGVFLLRKDPIIEVTQ